MGSGSLGVSAPPPAQGSPSCCPRWADGAQAQPSPSGPPGGASAPSYLLAAGTHPAAPQGPPVEVAGDALPSPRDRSDMSRLLLLLSALLEIAPGVAIAYKVLEVFPKSRRVQITCHLPQAPPPITYSLWGSQDIEVAKKVVKTHVPASFSINVTLKSRADLLTYSCQAASRDGHAASTKLQMYWELWTKPVSQLQADFTLLGSASAPRVEISCRAASGSPPITYSLVGKDGRVHTQQSPEYGQPANFSFQLTQTSNWLQCQAANDISVQYSTPTLVPPGERPSWVRVLGSGLAGGRARPGPEDGRPARCPPPGQLPQGPTLVLAGSLCSIAAVTTGMLGWSAWAR
ncbi:PREDICTED: uncharacterized protein C17orf99 homolog [Condylura cristata]|uniref:uncharacterized protein C17orf99 homolog n=1 Tax=Condylura cristata TaxID=143302 RepID=UPI0003344787|nr:PREDICTED: uncharacterized protein C17orf99 homolog [Condylura cristata]